MLVGVLRLLLEVLEPLGFKLSQINPLERLENQEPLFYNVSGVVCLFDRGVSRVISMWNRLNASN